MNFYVSFMANGLQESFQLINNTTIINHGQIHLQNKVFPSVFLFEDDQVLLRHSLPGYSVQDCGADFIQDTPLYDGMFIVAKCLEESMSYQILVQSMELLTIGHRYYHLKVEILVGSGESCQIKRRLVNTLSHEHIKIHKQGNRTGITSLNPQGVYVNGHWCQSRLLVSGDMISCMGLSLVFMGDYLAVSCQGIISLDEFFPKIASFPPKETGEVQLERPPRVNVPLERGVVEILPPVPKAQSDLPVVVTAGPSFAMTIGMLVSAGFGVGSVVTMGEFENMVVSGIASFSFLLGALLWPGYVAGQHKRVMAKEEEKRLSKYSLYSEMKVLELEEKYNRNRKVWNEVLAPEPANLVKMVERFNEDHSLWERTQEDKDFLDVRLGLGRHDFEVKVEIPGEIFLSQEDELSKQPHVIADKYKTIKDVPETLSLAEARQVGIFGERKQIYDMTKSIMMEVMALHSPDVVKVACFFGEDDKDDFLWAKDLPALWSNDQSVRFMASTQEEAHAVLRYMEHRTNDHPGQETYVLFVSQQSLLHQKLLTKQFLYPSDIPHVYSVFLEEKLSQLPKGCRATIRCTENSGGLYIRRNEENWLVRFMPDELNENVVQDFQKAMLSVPFAYHRGHDELVDSVGFLDMFHCGTVEALQVQKRWLNHRSHKSLSAPLGLTAGEALFSLDIHEEYHGCHGLVVGESEEDKTILLQSMILSMMVCHSPADFSVLLMEFADSHFVDPFRQAPHVLGTVSSIPQCRGMMIPLRLEIQRRKRLFRNIAKTYELDSLDINGYQKFFLEGKVTEVITRVAVVVDEFLPLLRDDPKLLEELLHLVKVGQLWGIHLILATATPSIVKDAHFASQFRVCLNLSHPTDMQDIMGLDPVPTLRHAGRCVVQVGQNEVYAEVQTGNCRHIYVKQAHFLPPHAQTVVVIDNAGQRVQHYPIKNNQEVTDKTQLEAVLDYLKEMSEQEQVKVTPFLYHEMDHPLPRANMNAELEAVPELFVPEATKDPYELEAEAYYQAKVEEVPVAKSPAPEVYQEPVAEAPAPEVYQEPVAESPAPEVYQEPVTESPAPEVYQEPVAEVPAPEVYEEPVAEVPVPEVYEEPVAESPIKSSPMDEDVKIYPSPYNQKGEFEPEAVYDQEGYYAPETPMDNSVEDIPKPPQKPVISQEDMGDFSGNFHQPQSYQDYEDPQPFASESIPVVTERNPLDFPEFGAKPPPPPNYEKVKAQASVQQQTPRDYLEKIIADPPPTMDFGKHSPAPSQEPDTKPLSSFSAPFSNALSRQEEVQEEVQELDAARDAFLQRNRPAMTLEKINLSQVPFGKGLFIGGTQEEDMENLMVTLGHFTQIHYVFSPREKFAAVAQRQVWGELELEQAVDEIREAVWTMSTENTVILIPHLQEFCQTISRCGLDRLTRMLKKYFAKVTVITGDIPSRLETMRQEDFFQLAVKQAQGIVTNPEELDKILPYLDQGLAKPNASLGEIEFLYYLD